MHIKTERTCIACRTKSQQNEMLRVAKLDTNVEIDKNNKMQGRGAYICKKSDCICNVIKKKLLNRAFKTILDSKIYEDLGVYEQNN